MIEPQDGSKFYKLWDQVVRPMLKCDEATANYLQQQAYELYQLRKEVEELRELLSDEYA